jgi:hypothetical protein
MITVFAIIYSLTPITWQNIIEAESEAQIQQSYWKNTHC